MTAAPPSDWFLTYMMMLLIGAPVLIGDPVARRFLEQAQYRCSVPRRDSIQRISQTAEE